LAGQETTVLANMITQGKTMCGGHLSSRNVVACRATTLLKGTYGAVVLDNEDDVRNLKSDYATSTATGTSSSRHDKHCTSNSEQTFSTVRSCESGRQVQVTIAPSSMPSSLEKPFASKENDIASTLTQSSTKTCIHKNHSEKLKVSQRRLLKSDVSTEFSKDLPISVATQGISEDILLKHRKPRSFKNSIAIANRESMESGQLRLRTKSFNKINRNRDYHGSKTNLVDDNTVELTTSTRTNDQISEVNAKTQQQSQFLKLSLKNYLPGRTPWSKKDLKNHEIEVSTGVFNSASNNIPHRYCLSSFFLSFCI
jgi:hypothetical protein